MRQLVLTFSDKSWVEIKDASQRVILSGEFPGGDRQVASGKPPFQLWVGRASAVRILDGEREIDLKPHARDEVARLTVD
jgi:cytoskeleton protein RodZ